MFRKFYNSTISTGVDLLKYFLIKDYPVFKIRFIQMILFDPKTILQICQFFMLEFILTYLDVRNLKYSSLIQFDPFLFVLILLVSFDTFWSILNHYDPFWSILIHFDLILIQKNLNHIFFSFSSSVFRKWTSGPTLYNSTVGIGVDRSRRQDQNSSVPSLG